MEKKSTLRRILVFVKPHWPLLLLSLVSSIISVCALLYIPILIGNAVDSIIGPDNVDFSGVIIILYKLIISVIVYAIFHWLMSYTTTIVAHKSIKNIRISAFNIVQVLPLRYIDNNAHGDIISKMIGDVEAISVGLLQGFTHLFTGIITIIGTLIFMLTINLELTIVVVVITPLSLIIANFIARRTFKNFKETSRINGELGAHIEEMITNQRVIKAFGYEEKSELKFTEINNRLYKAGFSAQVYSSLINPVTRFINSLVYAIVGVIGALFIIGDHSLAFTVGSLSCFLAYANQYTKPFNEVSGVISELQAALASADRIFSIIDEPIEKSDEDCLEVSETSGQMTIENVCFSYTPEKKLIENFNLKVKPGERIAIVGPTGCGKTTLINLLMRFYDITNGSIKIDNLDINNIKRKSLRKLYGMVLQDTWVFKGSIKENIAYGRKDATDEEIIKTAKIVNIHSVITKMTNGYDTIISDNSSLSEGERQLLCIARVILNMPSMLILDEATSSIDTLTEINIQKAFKMMMTGRTSFIIAHRLSTIMHCDVILVMNNGDVIEQGTHSELLEKRGFYYNLYNSQYES